MSGIYWLSVWLAPNPFLPFDFRPAPTRLPLAGEETMELPGPSSTGRSSNFGSFLCAALIIGLPRRSPTISPPMRALDCDGFRFSSILFSPRPFVRLFTRRPACLSGPVVVGFVADQRARLSIIFHTTDARSANELNPLPPLPPPSLQVESRLSSFFARTIARKQLQQRQRGKNQLAIQTASMVQSSAHWCLTKAEGKFGQQRHTKAKSSAFSRRRNSDADATC